MKSCAGIILLAFALFVTAAQTQDTQLTSQAEASALRWLALTDTGRFDQSWAEAAEMFQANIAKAAWASAAANARSPLGHVLSRKVRSAKYARSLPGVPDGEYVVIQFETSFEKKVNATELVTPVREKDGSWKVSGYFIK